MKNSILRDWFIILYSAAVLIVVLVLFWILMVYVLLPFIVWLL